MRIALITFLLMLSLAVQGQVLINEVCPANADIIYDPDFFNFSNWIELYNAGNANVDVSGFHLSNSNATPQQWAIPAGTIISAKGYLTVWCDSMNFKLHTNFTIEPNAGQVILSSAAGSQLDQVVYPTQYFNTSYARITDGNATWARTSEPTPAKQNVAGPANGRLPKVSFTLPSGKYLGVLAVSMNAQAGNQIRYTTDGSEPTSKSALYASPFTIHLTTVVKAKAFHASYLPSETASVTYLINEHDFGLPVVSLSTNPKYLWNDTLGIYVEGTNGKIGPCSANPFNWNQDWNRHAVFEYLDVSGTQQYQQHLNFKMAGQCDRSYPQKSFELTAKKEFGFGKIGYPFFASKPIRKYDKILLRNSGYDFNIIHFRDALLQSFPQGNMDVDYMAYQPAAIYLNAQYWGILNLREKIDGDFIENNYGINQNDIDLIENNVATEGTLDAWNNYVDSLALLNPNDPNTIKFIEKHVDVQEYINYLALQVYYANTSWPNNVKSWRQRSTNGKFRWILTDLDLAFSTDSLKAEHPTLDFATDPASTGRNTPTFTKPIRLALAVPAFRDRFLATLSSAMGSTLQIDRVVEIINQFKAKLDAEMPHHKQRWGKLITEWEFDIQKLREFAFDRNVFMKKYLGTYFSLGRVSLATEITPSLSGKIKLNGVAAPASFNQYYTDVSYSLTALPNPGFNFKDWSVSQRSGTVVDIAKTGDVWKYWDAGVLPSPSWKNPTYSDATWKQGPSELGYGDGDEQTVVGSGPSSLNKYITTYFRKSFAIADTAKVFDLLGSVVFDDGVIVYLNGTEVYRGNMLPDANGNSAFAFSNRDIETKFDGFTIPRGILVNGTNTFAVEVHQFNANSSDISFDLKASMFEVGSLGSATVFSNPIIEGTANTSILAQTTFEPVSQITSLVINEISADSTLVLDYKGQAEDWVELFNNGSNTIDLDGLFVSDDISKKGKFRLTAGDAPWTLNSGGYEVLWADNDSQQGRDHLNFKLSGKGDRFSVYQLVGFDTVALASIVFGPQPDGFSLARIPNATGKFENTFSLTPGASNLQVPVVQGLVINEFITSASAEVDEQGDRDEWIELFNSGSTAIDLNGLFITDSTANNLKHRLNAGLLPWLLQAGAYQILWADGEVSEGFKHLSFKLSSEGERIGLFQLTGGDTVQLSFTTFGKQLKGFSSARIPNATGPFVTTFALTPGASNKLPEPLSGLVLNEFSAVASTAVDEAGDQDDWIELLNTSGTPFNMAGLFITNNHKEKLKHVLYNNGLPMLIAPNVYQLLWADDETFEGSNHLSFKLSSAGDEIGLYQLAGGDTVEIFLHSFEPQAFGYSLARLPNGSGPFVFTSNITPGETNDESDPQQLLYPNPAHSHFKTLIKEEGAVLSIYNYFGSKLTAYNFSTPNEAFIDVSELPAGFYFVKVVYPSGTKTTNLLVTH